MPLTVLKRWALVAAATALLAALLAPVSPRTASAAFNAHVQLVNVSDHDFWVSWYTDQQAIGSIEFGSSCASLTHQSPEQPGDGYVHLVDAGSGVTLAPNTTFYYKLVDSGMIDDTTGSCYSATTLPLSSAEATPSLVSGTVKAAPDCTTPAAGALVTLTILHAGTTSLPLAAASSSDGGWSIDVSAASDQAGKPISPSAGDSMTITAAAATDNVQTVTATYQPAGGVQQLPDICLPGVMPQEGGAATATVGTLTPTSTPTSTLVPTNTSTPSPTSIPTATSTPTATPTATPVPNTPTPSPAPTATRTRPRPTATPSPTPEPTITPVQEQQGSTLLRLRAHLVKSSVRRGEKEQLLVNTVSRARVTMVVTYPHQGGIFHSSFLANKSGYWARTWVVRTTQTGVATVLVTAARGSQSRHFHRYFTVR